METTYTNTDFAVSIRRELAKRQTTYPKIMAKKVAAGATQAEQIELSTAQRIQYELLDDALRAIEHGQPLDTMHATAVLQELEREMKCRKNFYGFLVWKKRITRETADYEKALWAAIIVHWKENYCTPARDDKAQLDNSRIPAAQRLGSVGGDAELFEP